MHRNHGGSSGDNIGAGGPLITHHLKDIELELNLLKRKREMLEQQQFIQPLIPQRNFNQVPYYALESEQSSSNRDFSHLYDDGHQQTREPFTRKRQANEWQDDSYPKRSYGQGPHSSNPPRPAPIRNKRPYDSGRLPARAQYQPKRTQHYQPKPAPRYGQSKPSIGQKISNQTQQKPSKFTSNKVTKPKSSVPPNKLNSQPITERKKLVTDTVKSLATLDGPNLESLRLLPNKEPTKQMTGRLELALGSILRDIREKFGEDPRYEVLRLATLQRVVKQTIRERIRKAMLGKVVGSTIEIVKAYRDVYPNATDIQIVNIALKASGIKPKEVENSAPQEIAQEIPEEYFNKTMIQILGKHLHEMFDKIEEIYNPKTQPEKEICSKEDSVDNKTVESNKENGDEVANVSDDSKTDNGTADNQASTEKSEDPKDDGVIDVKESETASEVNGTPANNTNSEELIALSDEYKKLLPGILKKHIPSIVKLIYLKKMYKQAIGVLDRSPTYVDYGKTDESTTSTKSEMPESSLTPNKLAPHNTISYFVKVMGKPQLPKKDVMNTFLNKFNPKSIKKHRTVHNLLFIGFNDKSDFEGIVKEDGVVIGPSTLSIRVCEKNTKAADKNAATPNGNVIDDKDKNNSPTKHVKNDSASDSDILGAELDGQISDLLASIKNAVDDERNNSINSSTENTDNDVSNLDDSENKKANNESLDIKETENKVKEELGAKEQSIDDKSEEMKSDSLENKPAIDTKNGEVTNVKQDSQENYKVKEEPKETERTVDEKKDQIAELKGTAGKATPTRASTRLANTATTPSTIRTRRTSRLMNN